VLFNFPAILCAGGENLGSYIKKNHGFKSPAKAFSDRAAATTFNGQ